MHLDGSVRWVKFEKILFLHCGNAGGSCDACCFQEDIGLEWERQIARLRPRL